MCAFFVCDMDIMNNTNLCQYCYLYYFDRINLVMSMCIVDALLSMGMLTQYIGHPDHAVEFIRTKVKPDHKMCLSTDSDMHRLIALVVHAIITMPVKAAGTFLKNFADQ